MNNRSSKRIQRKHWHVYVVVAGIIILVGGVLIAVAGKGDQETTPSDTAEAVVYSTDTPDESKENAESYDWSGQADDPKKVTIPSAGVEAYVQRVGVDQYGKMAVPTNIHLLGWFVDSVKPGQKGLSIIDGHFGGRTMPAVFAELGTLQVGDTFVVERGDGKVLNYSVIKTTTIPEAESASVLFSQDPQVKSQLNLITCGGIYDSARQTYSDRVVIYAALQN